MKATNVVDYLDREVINWTRKRCLLNGTRHYSWHAFPFLEEINNRYGGARGVASNTAQRGQEIYCNGNLSSR